MTTTRRTLIGLAIVAAVLAAWWLFRMHSTTPVADSPMQDSAERIVPAGCDPLPQTASLPGALAPSTPTVEGVVHALDASLSDTHKAFLRCFPDEEDLIARVHTGFGRWLRNTLRLSTVTPLSTTLAGIGARNADEMSTVLVRVYSRALRGAPLDVPDAVARTRAMAETFLP